MLSPPPPPPLGREEARSSSSESKKALCTMCQQKIFCENFTPCSYSSPLREKFSFMGWDNHIENLLWGLEKSTQMNSIVTKYFWENVAMHMHDMVCNCNDEIVRNLVSKISIAWKKILFSKCGTGFCMCLVYFLICLWQQGEKCCPLVRARPIILNVLL